MRKTPINKKILKNVDLDETLILMGPKPVNKILRSEIKKKSWNGSVWYFMYMFWQVRIRFRKTCNRRSGEWVSTKEVMSTVLQLPIPTFLGRKSSLLPDWFVRFSSFSSSCIIHLTLNASLYWLYKMLLIWVWSKHYMCELWWLFSILRLVWIMDSSISRIMAFPRSWWKECSRRARTCSLFLLMRRWWWFDVVLEVTHLCTTRKVLIIIAHDNCSITPMNTWVIPASRNRWF